MSKKKKKYAARAPLGVKGGIRAQTARGWHARAWWSRHWTEVMEDFRLGARLGRGRTYAVSGQVSALSVAAGRVTATVQGSAREPYVSEIRFRCVRDDAKRRIVAALKARPVHLARLLVGDLPPEVEALFRGEGCPLFPERANDLESRCSCPDWANPCKHLAAVYFLIGEAVSRNPLLLLALRGVSREDLAEPAPAANGAARPAEPDGPQGATARPTPEEFYGAPQPAFSDFGTADKTAVAAPLIRRLGPLPFWRGQERFADTLEHLYARAAPRGWAVWTGEPLDLRREDEKVIITGANLHLRHRKMRVDASWM